MKDSNLLFAAMVFLCSLSAKADDQPLLKRTDVKSYEGYIQVIPGDSDRIQLTAAFIKPAYDYKPTSSGAMVGLIQKAGGFSKLKIKIDNNCKGDIQIKIGIKEFAGDSYGYYKSNWSTNQYLNTVNLKSAAFKDKTSPNESPANDSVTRNAYKLDNDIVVTLPKEITYRPGDILVLEDIVYSTDIDRIFRQCSINISAD